MNDVFGKKLGQYVLLEQLGEGGMAKVFNALDTRVESNVAIKVILPNKRSSQVFLEQFQMEARALANLTHTNIVKVLNYGVENEQPYLVMEFVAGGTLKEAMNQKIPWQTAAAILAPIARALEYVHHQQIVHRDVKPSNILLQEDFRPMLSDFGILKLLETKEEKVSSAIGVGVGTPEYMSPEQGMGKEVDFKADIYSLGLVFYEMVTGRKPFTADSPMAMVLKHVTDELPLPTTFDRRLPKFVELAILRAVQKKPEDRYASMGEFADVLEMIALGEKAPEEKIVKLARKRNKKLKYLPAILLTALLAIVVGASVWGYNQFYRVPQPTALPDVPPVGVASAIATKTAAPIAETKTGQTPEPAETLVPTTPPPPDLSSSVALLGTPLPVNRPSQPVEIARWGIGGVNVVAWSPDGDTIALGTSSGIFLYRAREKDPYLFIDTKFNVVAMTFNPDGSEIAGGSPDGDVIAWNSASGNLERSFSYKTPASDRISTSPSRFVTALSYSSNGKNIAAGFQNGTINYFSVDQRSVLLAVDEVPAVEDLVVSGDGRFIYVSNGGRTISVWDIQAQKKTLELNNPTPISKLGMSRDRQYLLGGGVANSVYVWDLFEQRHITSFVNLGGAASAFDFSYDDKYVALGVNTGEVRVFAMPGSEDYSKTHLPLQIIKGYDDPIQTVAFSPNQLVVAAGNWEEGLKLWDALTGESIFSLDQSMRAIHEIHFSADGSWLATSHDDATVRIWRLASAQLAYQVDGTLPKGNPFSPDNKYLATVHSPGRNKPDAVQVVELATGNVVADLPGYPPKAFVQFSDDSKLLIAGTAYQANIWDVATWEQIKSSGGPTAGCGQFFTPQNKLLTVISNAGILFSYEQNIQDMCGTRIEGATMMYYFPKRNRLLFVLGNGSVWLGNKDSFDISRRRFPAPYPLPGEIFLAGNQEGGWYAYAAGNKVQVRNVNGSANTTIDNQDDYHYRVAFLPGQKLFALGSKYGSIHIWTLP